MDNASKIALLTGFGGVVLGGAITYLSEWHFRRQETKKNIRKNFTLCLIEVGRLTDELTSIYNTCVVTLPNEAPTLISLNIRSFASTSINMSSFETEKLFSIYHKKDDVFTDVSLFFRRFNSNIETLQAVNIKSVERSARWLRDGVSIPTLNQDLAQVRISLTDAETIAELVTIENLYRIFFRSLIEDIRNGRKLIERLNMNSDRKFKGIFKAKAPKLEVLQDFEPLPYLENMPFFSMSDLPSAE